MKTIEPEHGLAVAAGTDAANRSMRAAGRTAWNLQDRAKAIAAYEAIMGSGAPTV